MDPKQIKEDMDVYLGKMREALPDMVQGFGNLFGNTMKDSALSVKYKELIALGIGVAVHCPTCIVAHVNKCVEAGATREEILDAASVAVVMGGGPAYTHISLVMKTLEDLGK